VFGGEPNKYTLKALRPNTPEPVETSKDVGLSDYFASIKRRWRLGFAIGVPIVLGALILAFTLPTTYSSPAEFRFEKAAIGDNLGESAEYGLSRVYKVLLELLVIKTVTSFMARPLLWFCLLSTPMVVFGLLALGYTMISAVTGTDSISLPIAGSGLIMLFSAIILVSGGAFGELVYRVGDMRDHQFARLTQQVRIAPRADS
jgi:hypothetical protein